MNINDIILSYFSEGFDYKSHFNKRFQKYGTTKSGRIKGKANARSNVKAYELGFKHGIKHLSKHF